MTRNMQDNGPISLYDTPIIESIDEELKHDLSARHAGAHSGDSNNGQIAKAIAMGSVPVVLAALASDLKAQSNASLVDVLNFALTLEYLEAEFYMRGVNAATVMGIPAGDLPIFQAIAAHEAEHVAALQSLIPAKGGMAVPKPTFDFTAQGNLPGFNFGSGQYATFQALAQAFEDTGVRAYKGQAANPNLMADKAVLTAALSIHSVEARHAAVVRRLRGNKGWVSGSSRDTLPAFTQAIYDGDNEITQGGLALSSLSSYSAFGGMTSATEAFDEPLTMAQVNVIASLFIA